MNRDPRIDPRPGDIVSGLGGYAAKVIKVGEGRVTYEKLLGLGVADIPCWRKLAGKGEVFIAADDEPAGGAA